MQDEMIAAMSGFNVCKIRSAQIGFCNVGPKSWKRKMITAFGENYESEATIKLRKSQT